MNNADIYTGDYTVTPKDIEQQIKTKNKFLNKDLIVKKSLSLKLATKKGKYSIHRKGIINMAETKYINKVVYGGKTLIDLTGDTATADKVLKDMTFHDKTGATVTGTCPFDVDSSDATVAVAEILLERLHTLEALN